MLPCGQCLQQRFLAFRASSRFRDGQGENYWGGIFWSKTSVVKLSNNRKKYIVIEVAYSDRRQVWWYFNVKQCTLERTIEVNLDRLSFWVWTSKKVNREILKQCFPRFVFSQNFAYTINDVSLYCITKHQPSKCCIWKYLGDFWHLTFITLPRQI
jgi:hypothetical protein